MKNFTAFLQLFSVGTLIASLTASLPAQAQYPTPYPAPYPVPAPYPAPYPAPGMGGYPAIPSTPVPPSPYPANLGGYPGSYPPPVRTSATTFICGRSGNDPATLVQANGRMLRSPLIVWRTEYFGDDYTPEQRCQSVSQRLTQVVAQNGGRLSNLRLSVGRVYGLTVVCYLNNSATCNQDNILFTLKPENARNAPGILSRLSSFGQYGGGASINESGGDDSSSAGGSINLETEVTQAEQMEGGSPAPSGYNSGGYAPAPTYQPDSGSMGGGAI